MIFGIIISALLFAVLFSYFIRISETPGKCSSLLVLGSGGHTAELLSYVREFAPEYSPRIYVIASTDPFSDKKAIELEEELSNREYLIERLPRAREVGQSYLSSIFTSCYAVLFAAVLILKYRPRLVLCNGPGTCVPVCLAARMLHVLNSLCGLRRRRGGEVVFVESVCRTRSLSVSGRLLYHLRLAHVIVQWPALLNSYPRATYLGLLS